MEGEFVSVVFLRYHRPVRVIGAIIAAALFLVCGADVDAQGRRPKKDNVEPAYRSNLPPERLPVPIEDDGSTDVKKPAASETSLFFVSWHAALCRYMPSPAAWAVLAAPVWLPLLIAIVVWMRRRSPVPAGPAARKGPPAKAPPPEETTKPAPAPRARRQQAHQQTSKVPSVEEAVELSREQEVLCARHGEQLSIYDLFVALGPRADALRAFRRAAQSTLDANRWSGTVRDGKLERLRPLCVLWVRELAMARISAWLSSHPLVKERRLLVQVPGILEPGEVDGLALTEADGLAATLSPELQELQQQGRQALSLVAEASDRPLVLMATAKATGIAALLGPNLGDTEIGEGLQQVYGLWLLLGGVAALNEGAGIGLSRAELGPEFRDALKEHERLVGTPVPAEGCAVHAIQALGGGNLDGAGTLLAAVAGAAFSPSSIVLRMSKLVGEIKEASTLSALARLGELVAPLLADETSAEGKALLAAIRTVLGEDLLKEEVRRCLAMSREMEKPLAKEPLWKTSSGAPVNPDVALLALHEARVEHTAAQALLARERLLHILEKLANAGERSSEKVIAARRLGCAIAGLGMPLLRSTSTDLLSAAREALASLKGIGMGLG